MNAIPWYQSRVYIGAVVAIISQIVVLLGKQDAIPIESISTNVEAAFQLIALLATGYAAWKRQRSSEQPLTLTKAGALNKNQAGFARPLVFAMLLAIAMSSLLMLSACQTLPHKVVQVACDPATYTAERCAKGIAETWEVYQVRAEEIVLDSATPAEVKAGVQKAEAATRPAVVEMLKSAAAYKRIKDQIAAGATTDEQLLIANANLEEWVKVALPRIDAMGDALGL